MAWIATIDSKANTNQGTLLVQVTYSDGTHPNVIETYNVGSGPVLNRFIYTRLASLNAIDYASLAAIPNGVYTPTTPPATPQVDLDQANFFKWIQVTIGVNAAKSMGWITGTEQVVVDAKNKVLDLANVNLPKLYS